MKTIKTNFLATTLAFCLCLGMLTLSNCSSDDDAEVCSGFECHNGGEKIAGVDGCQCDCPPGYTGVNCEKAACPPTAECPIGKSPNPNNGCACE